MYVQCRIHNSSPLLSLLDEFSPSYLIPLFSILILSRHLRLCLPISLFPSSFPTKSCTHLSSPLTCHLPLPYRPPSLHHLNINICVAVQVMQNLTMLLPIVSSCPSLSGPDILLSTLFSNTLSLRSTLNVSDQDSHPHKLVSVCSRYRMMQL
jgi:hypothetical protein